MFETLTYPNLVQKHNFRDERMLAYVVCLKCDRNSIHGNFGLSVHWSDCSNEKQRRAEAQRVAEQVVKNDAIEEEAELRVLFKHENLQLLTKH